MLTFWKKDKEKSEAVKRLEQAIDEFRQGKQNYLPAIYQALASKDKEAMKLAAHEIAQYMKGLDSNQLIRLDERFREYSSMEWNIWWEKVDLSFWKVNIENTEDYLWSLRLGTFHPNGYFREKCIWELAGEDDSVRFVLLRLNDWAAPVREAAQAAAAYITELKAEALVACLPYLEKVKQGGRRDRNVLQELEDQVGDRIQSQLQHVDLCNLKKYDIRARKYLYRLLLERKLLTKEEVDLVLNREKSSQCQVLLMTYFLRYYECSVEELDNYLQHKSKVVQRKALEQKYNMLKTAWVGLEKLLLASTVGTRGMVSYILRKHTEFDIVAYYAERLETPQKKICILGIGENGGQEDAGLLMKYLEELAEGIVKNTLHAISLLQGAKAADIFWKYLLDERPVVMRQAYREIVANDITFGAKQVFETFVQTESQLLREKLAHQLLRERSWDRLPYVLKLYWYEDEQIRDILWWGVHGRSVYAQLSKEEAENIRRIMYDEKYRIPKKLQEEIEFDLKFIVKG
ncbi:MAG: hypothetical protein IJ379_07985 [Lachnospiraceae bacterium]|nr:hypothetical protein [Lachnospiraceae bacterium]